MPILDINDLKRVTEYEAFVSSSPDGHQMQSLNWSKVKEGWESDYVYLTDENDEIYAAMSILSVKNDGVHAFMYAPRGPVCDFYDIQTVQKLIEEAKPIAEKHQAFLLRMDPEVPFDQDLVDEYRALDYDFRSREQDEHAFSNPRHHMIVDLTGQDEESLMMSMTSRDRNKLRKTYRENLQTRRVALSDSDYEQVLDDFYELTKIMAERQGITHRPKAYFDRVMKSFPDASFFETYHEGDLLSSSLVVCYNQKAFYMYAASSNEKRNLNASIQMNFEAIKYALKQNMKQYDMGGVFELDSSDGLYRFKKIFTGDEGLKEYIGELDIVYDRELYEDFVQ